MLTAREVDLIRHSVVKYTNLLRPQSKIETEFLRDLQEQRLVLEVVRRQVNYGDDTWISQIGVTRIKRGVAKPEMYS